MLSQCIECVTSRDKEGMFLDETEVLRWWGVFQDNFIGFTNLFDNVNWPPQKDSKADVSSVSPSSGRIRRQLYLGTSFLLSFWSLLTKDIKETDEVGVNIYLSEHW